jgi:peptidoglycan/LPS O-acetylase OafA/YrhL
MVEVSTPIDARAGTHVPALDGVRGVAIALVLLSHVAQDRVTSAGWIGVDLFFVLSGFLITGILWDSRERRHRVRTFYVRRALRILPLYYGVLVAVFVAVAVVHSLHTDQNRQLFREQWWYWAYVPNWLIALRHRVDGGSLAWFWSLAIEEQFYLVWPLIVWHASGRTIVRVCLGTLVAGLVIRSVLVFTHADAYASRPLVYMLTPCRLDGLVVGSLIAMKVRDPGGYADLWRRIRVPALVCATFLCANALLQMEFGAPAMARSPIVETVGYPALAIAFGGLLVASLGPWRQVMSARPLRWLGVYSYGIYVLHPFAVDALRQWSHLVLGTWAFAIAATAASLAIAWLSYQLYERHWLALKRRWT